MQSKAQKRSSAQRKKAFLEAYLDTASVQAASREMGIKDWTHYRWLKTDPNYVKAFEFAREKAVQALEAEARRRALDGVEEPVFYKGEECGRVKRYSDILIIFLLKAARPEVYRDRYDYDLTLRRGEATLDPGREKLSDKDLEKLLELARERELVDKAPLQLEGEVGAAAKE